MAKADLTAAGRAAAAKSGAAMKDGSYPIEDEEDLHNAIRAVGRGKANSHNAIRKHIMERAHALGLSKLIPPDWKADGSLADSQSSEYERAEDWDGDTDGDEWDDEALAKGEVLPPGEWPVVRERAADRWSFNLDLPLTSKREETLAASRDRVVRARIGIQLRAEGVQPLDGWTDSQYSGRFRGLASAWNTRAYIGAPPWGFVEELDPGCMNRAAREDDVRFLHNHDPNLLLARSSAGTLRLVPEVKGLRAEGDMAPTSYAKDLAVLLHRGDINAMSFGFQTAPGGESWSRVSGYEDKRFPALRTQGVDVVRIMDVSRLKDVSTVTYPAYQGTEALLRAERSATRGNIAVNQDTRELDELELALLGRITK